jgi:hypothetical protein
MGVTTPGLSAQHQTQQILLSWLAQRNYRIISHGGATLDWLLIFDCDDSNSSKALRRLQNHA